MDDQNWTILESLQQDARLGFAELGRRLGVSAPTAAERVKRLEDRGVLTGYHAAVDPAALGYALSAFVRMSVPPKDYARFRAFAAQTAEILECHHITGEAAFLLKVVAESVPALESLIGRLSAWGPTSTSLVLSTYVPRRPFTRPTPVRRRR
jgi:Lrp/AsnC family leucine-responsive transcriptional regulator